MRLLSLWVFCALGASAQALTPESDLKEIAEYRLTLDKVDRFTQASRNLAVLMKGRTEEFSRWQAESPADNSISALTRHLEKQPELVRALRQAGLSPREFYVFFHAYLQASLAHAAHKHNPTKPLGPNLSAANVDFVAKNEARLERFNAEMKALER